MKGEWVRAWCCTAMEVDGDNDNDVFFTNLQMCVLE